MSHRHNKAKLQPPKGPSKKQMRSMRKRQKIATVHLVAERISDLPPHRDALAG